MRMGEKQPRLRTQKQTSDKGGIDSYRRPLGVRREVRRESRSGQLSQEGALNRTTKQDAADIDTLRSRGRKLNVPATFSVQVHVE